MNTRNLSQINSDVTSKLITKTVVSFFFNIGCSGGRASCAPLLSQEKCPCCVEPSSQPPSVSCCHSSWPLLAGTPHCFLHTSLSACYYNKITSAIFSPFEVFARFISEAGAGFTLIVFKTSSICSPQQISC